MKRIEPINISPSFLSKVIDKGYDYAVGEKLGIISKDTASMSAGRTLHALLASSYGGPQPEIAICPYDNYRTKEAREWRDNTPDNVVIISQKDADTYSEIVERVKNHPEVKAILEGRKVEPEKEIVKQINGFNVKGVLDIVATKGESTVVIDWKFCSSQVFDSFAKKALWQNYDLQASVYDFLTNANQTYFVAIENEAPHRIKVWHCDMSVLDSGAEKFNQAMQIIKEADWRSPTFDIAGVGELMAWGY